jgi:hypothetical protein
MKTIMKSVLVGGAAVLAVTMALAKGGGGGQQPVHTVRYTFKETFTNAQAGVDSTASATASASESLQGNGKDTENLNLTLKGLTPSTPYSLFATTTTNSSFDAADFNSDTKGNAKLTLSTKPGKKGVAIGGLDPLTGVTELDILNDSSSNSPVTVLTADTTMPSSFTFSDKQSATGASGESGTLTVSASSKSSKLTLSASGLTPSNSFALSLNGTPTTNNTFTSTSKGTLKISTPISPNVLDLTEVDLVDASTSASVLTFPMP